MSTVALPPGPAPAGWRRRALPALCAALLAVPVVALPVVAGPALADAPVEPVVEQASAVEVGSDVEAAPGEEPAVEATAAATPSASASASASTPTTVPDPAIVSPVVHEEEDPDDVGPQPDDAARPDLVVEVAGPATGWAGGEGAYTMSVANAATATAPAGGFTLSYSVPPGQTVLSVDSPVDSAWACVLGDAASCTWSGELAVGEQAAPVTVLVGHGRRAAGRMTGTAKVSYLDGEVVLADNTATVVTAMQAPDLTLAVAAPERAAAGETVSMVLSVTNIGPGWASSFALHGDVSDGVTVDGLSGTGFACDVAALRCAYDGELAPGLSAAATLTGVVDAAHTGGPLTTTAQVDQAALMASALTAVTAAPPAAAPPPAAPAAKPPVAAPPAAPVAAAPPPPVRAARPNAVAPVRAPVTRVAPPTAASPTAAGDTRPATLPFTDGAATLPFTGAHRGSLLGSGVALVLWGIAMTVLGRRRTA